MSCPFDISMASNSNMAVPVTVINILESLENREAYMVQVKGIVLNL